MIKKKDLSKEDKDAWDNFTKYPSDIFDKEKENIKKIFRKERFKYDLHGFSLEKANKKVEEIIQACVDQRYKEILLITGKGLHSNVDNDVYASMNLSKLKYSVPKFIKNNNELNKYIISIVDASTKDGGEGAILIKLKNL